MHHPERRIARYRLATLTEAVDQRVADDCKRNDDDQQRVTPAKRDRLKLSMMIAPRPIYENLISAAQ